jgi:hypothetical protein
MMSSTAEPPVQGFLSSGGNVSRLQLSLDAAVPLMLDELDAGLAR